MPFTKPVCSIILVLLFFISSLQSVENSLAEILRTSQNPPMDCWPHTRWWWPGNPVSKSEITWQLDQMRSVGIRGVEQITMSPVYEKVDIPYLSDEFMEMVKHTVAEAKRLGMEVSFNFGGPGWIISGEWVPKQDQSKDLVPTSMELSGPKPFRGKLPSELTRTKRSWEIYHPELRGDEKLLAVVAGKIEDGIIEKNSLQIITRNVQKNILNWQVPPGRWKIMAFWLARNGHANAVDHFNKAAMERYCNYLGNKFKKAVGKEFGKTVDSFFCDSFELPNLASGIYWSTHLLSEFKRIKGYDLTKYLPAIWWEVGDISPKIRYDVNEFLHLVGMDAFFDTFLSWCEDNGVKGRIQTYGFTTDNIQAAGVTHIPEMEITPGEKDSAPWFDTRIGPKKYVASGAHIYGREIVSVEAFTFLHWERYRATMEEVKIAADGFLRSGATKFYNHGYSFLPERDLAPSRRTPWAPQINPSNTWWKYYPFLTEYIARCSYLLRQGHFAPDIAIYSPLANQWTKDVLNPRKWTREFDWGELGELLISNGYDFDLLNDDAIQNLAKFENGKIKIRNMEYKILLLPNIEAIPLESFQQIPEYVKSGGIVIALDRIPEFSTGLKDYQKKDEMVKNISRELFEEPFGRDAVGQVNYGKGVAYFLKMVINRKIWWDQRSSTLDPFLNTIHSHLAPDFSIDFALEGIRKNEGLTFLHRKVKEADIYFVTNIQDRPTAKPVTFRTDRSKISELNPHTGKITPLVHFEMKNSGIKIPLKLNAYESTFIIFEDGEPPVQISRSNWDRIRLNPDGSLSGFSGQNGTFRTEVKLNEQELTSVTKISDLPAPFGIEGTWEMTLEGKDFPEYREKIAFLDSWTNNPRTRHFSGTGKYEITFDLPEQYISPDLNLNLDLGKSGNIGEVVLNEIPVGTVWMRNDLLDITPAARSGENKLVVLVTNTNINRVSGFEKLPPVPAHLLKRFGGTAQPERLSPEIGFKPLPASGLMGPVRIIPLKRAEIHFEK